MFVLNLFKVYSNADNSQDSKTVFKICLSQKMLILEANYSDAQSKKDFSLKITTRAHCISGMRRAIKKLSKSEIIYDPRAIIVIL
jgi:hypothetical protein